MRKFTTALALACTMALAVATGAVAQTNQTGLVNVNATGNTIQVPIALAANICGVTIAVLATDLADGSAACTALAASGATVTPRESGSNTQQDGLINVNVSDNTVQVPIAAAVNVCDVEVLVLATALLGGATQCTAGAGSAGIA